MDFCGLLTFSKDLLCRKEVLGEKFDALISGINIKVCFPCYPKDTDEKLKELSLPSHENLYRFVIDYADGIVVASDKADATLVEYARQSGKPMLEYQDPASEECFDNYNRFYENL